MFKDNTQLFVTDDKWLREGGVLDEKDQEMIEQMKALGPVIFLSLKEALESLQKHEPEKYTQFTEEMKAMHAEEMKKHGFVELDLETILKIAINSEPNKIISTKMLKMVMSKDQAEEVRQWRVDDHCTWRRIARKAFAMTITTYWNNWPTWQPSYNQAIGMTICEVAAEILNENYRETPWN